MYRRRNLDLTDFPTVTKKYDQILVISVAAHTLIIKCSPSDVDAQTVEHQPQKCYKNKLINDTAVLQIDT